MNYMNYIEDYVKNIDFQTPIFTKNIYEYVKKYNDEVDQLLLNTYIKRYMEKKDLFVRSAKGIYYKTIHTPFGYAPIDLKQLYKMLFIYNGEDVIGYETGPSFMTKLGLTTQLSKKIYFTTENNRNTIIKDYVELIKPVIDVTKSNYKYLQILDVINNKFNVYYEVENPNDIIYKYIKDNDLSFEKLLFYSRYYNNNNLVLKIADIARLGE